MDNSWESILLRFKSVQTATQLAPLLTDDMLVNGLAAWSGTPLRKKADISACEYDDEQSQWNWLWEFVEINYAMFGIIAGVKKHEHMDLFTRLKGLRLIYPDGTINALADKYVQQMIRKKLGLKESSKKPIQNQGD